MSQPYLADKLSTNRNSSRIDKVVKEQEKNRYILRNQNKPTGRLKKLDPADFVAITNTGIQSSRNRMPKNDFYSRIRPCLRLHRRMRNM